MASYKVPQDVEADDKLLGPFSFRQFLYLMAAFGLGMLAFALFQIFPLLAAIPIPFALFFIILALPIKKDQPMETYLAALLSFYFKPNRRFWIPGQSNSTILITAPKKVEKTRVRNISEGEAAHRLSFLSAIVDSEGQAIKNAANSSMRDEFYAEAYNTTDMFDQSGTNRLNHMINQDQQERREEVINQMRTAIEQSEYNFDRPAPMVQLPGQRVIQPLNNYNPNAQTIVQPSATPITSTFNETDQLDPNSMRTAARTQPSQPNPPSPTPSQPSRPTDNNQEVYVSLH